jgi:hypothetical protein
VDPREAVGEGEAIQEKKYPPNCILVKLDWYRGCKEYYQPAADTWVQYQVNS